MFYARPRKFAKSEVIALGLSPDRESLFKRVVFDT